VGATEIRKVMTALHSLVGSRVSGDRARHTATVRETRPAARYPSSTRRGIARRRSRIPSSAGWPNLSGLGSPTWLYA